MTTTPPFSRRIKSSRWLQDDFPQTARTALNHLLHDLVDRTFIREWIDVGKKGKKRGHIFICHIMVDKLTRWG